jgi:hypothetical protein
LEESIKDIRVGFFDFIKENYAVGATPDGFGQLATLFVTDVAWGRSDEARDGMFFHVFGHIDADDSVFAIEKSRGKGTGEFGFAYAGRSEKKERADRSFGVFQAGTSADDGVGDCLDRFVLPDYAFVEDLVETEELVFFSFEQPRNGDASPPRDDIADFLGGDFFANEFGLATFFFGIDGSLGGFQFLFEGGQATVLEFGDFIEVVAALGGFDFLSDLVYLCANLAGGLDPTPFRLPAGVEGIALGFEVCQLLFQSL